MNGQRSTLTDRERIEDALDHLASLREEVRLRASEAGDDAVGIFEQIDADLHEELSLPRPRTNVLASLARKLMDLRASVEPD